MSANKHHGATTFRVILQRGHVSPSRTIPSSNINGNTSVISVASLHATLTTSTGGTITPATSAALVGTAKKHVQRNKL